MAALLTLLVLSWTAGPILQGGKRLQPVLPGTLWPALSSQPQGPYHTDTAATQAPHECPGEFSRMYVLQARAGEGPVAAVPEPWTVECVWARTEGCKGVCQICAFPAPRAQLWT